MAGILEFFATFGMKQFSNMGSNIVQAIVAWDPETATQAEIEGMLKELDKITLEVGKAKADFDKEQKEANAVQKNFDRMIAAADILDGQSKAAKTGGDIVKASQIEASMAKLLDDLELLKPELEREKQEAQDAKEFYDELASIAQTVADKVKAARSMLDKAKRDMKKAETGKKVAAKKAEQAERLAGLRQDASHMGVALAAMNKAADEARAKAEAMSLKAKLLSPERTGQDPYIEAALKAASGGPALITQSSVSDRLAALKKS